MMLVALICSCVLSACGSNGAFTASTNCTISASNLDLAGCNFAHRDLKDLDLASDDLRRANLDGANLDGTDIQGADLRGAKIVGVTTDASTICVNAHFGPCSLPGLHGKK